MIFYVLNGTLNFSLASHWCTGPWWFCNSKMFAYNHWFVLPFHSEHECIVTIHMTAYLCLWNTLTYTEFRIIRIPMYVCYNFLWNTFSTGISYTTLFIL